MAESADGAMPERHPDIVRFLRSLEKALSVRATDPGVATAVAHLQASIQSAGRGQSCEASRLSVGVHLESALEAARACSGLMAGLADSFAAIEPYLHWARRPASGPFASESWLDGHANAMIVGRGGLERGDGIQIGVTLMAPDVRYPDHSHAPEEVYIILSPGRFKHGPSSWIYPGIGGTFHNVPNVTHAMASDDAPLLAIWSLWSA